MTLAPLLHIFHTHIAGRENLSSSIRDVTRQTLQRYAAGMAGNMPDGVERDNCSSTLCITPSGKRCITPSANITLLTRVSPRSASLLFRLDTTG
jgi:hypothetical protein